MDFWDRRAAKYEVAPREASFQRAIDGAIALLNPSDRVLDVGCGTGPAAREIAPHVASVHGIDASKEMIRIAKQNPAGCTFQHATLDAVGGTYTAALAFNILHLVDPAAMLRDIAARLEPGGLLIASTPCLADLPWHQRAAIRVITKVWRLRGLHMFTAAQLRRMVQTHFTVESMHHDDGAQAVWLVARRL